MPPRDLSYVTPTEKGDGIEIEYYGLACSLADLLLFPKKEKADANSTERFGGEAVNSNQVAGKVFKERFHLNQNKP